MARVEPDYFVYLKLQKHSGSSASIDTIPLRVNNISFSVDKQIPAIPIPLSGLVTGESSTVALDLGMSNKRISLSGFITETPIQRTHTKTGSTPTSLNFTAHELAQLIASGVDSTGIASYQAINELVILIDSKVDENYADRGSTKRIALTFGARGDSLSKDNTNVAIARSFSLADDHSEFLGHTGVKGFVQNFNATFSAESVDVEFSLEFAVATVLP